MKLDVILSMVAPMILSSAFIVLWKVRKTFPASGLMLCGLIIMVVARLADAVSENFDILTGNPAFYRREMVTFYMDFASDTLDAIGAVVLVVGFIRAIRVQSEASKHIDTLETLLPICASCKRIRNADNSWDTIEEYLEKSGSPPLTHGICPSCKDELVDTYQRRKEGGKLTDQ